MKFKHKYDIIKIHLIKEVFKVLNVALTGGPCAGKTTVLSILTQLLTSRGYKTFTVEEAPTQLIMSGIAPSKNISMEEFQEFVFEKQLLNEELCRRAAGYYDRNKVVIFYDRGLCDQMAYVDRKYFEKILNRKGMTLSDAYGRYDCVFHLVTAAKGAEHAYQWNNPDEEENGNNSARSESPEQAILKDEATLKAWVGHPHLRVIDNSSDFEGKVKRVIQELFSALGEPIPIETERKFLVKRPSEEELNNMEYISKTNIVQTYLLSTDATERRVRQRGTKEDGFNFYYTEKRPIGNGSREEIEVKISSSDYINYLSQADTSLHQISKTRYCFIYSNKYFELDIYPFSDEYAILEVELNSIDEDIELPNLKIVKEVTNDIRFKNISLAKTLSLIPL